MSWKKLAFVAITVALIWLALPLLRTQADPGNTLYVGTEQGDYSTIQAALDAAISGDTVIVRDGTYTGSGNKNLDFGGKAITVKSQNGALNCTINCQNSDRAFYFHNSEGSDSVVDGFTIKNGSAAGGGAIYCGSNCNITIMACIITGNSATNGGGICCYGSDPAIINCIIANNTASSDGGGLYCNYSEATITNCTVADNSASRYGGGLACLNRPGVTLNNTILWGNSAPTNGNQLYAVNTTVTLNYCDYANGTGDVGGSGTVTPNNCTTSDPLFVDADNGNYHLQTGSPCIDTGDNSLVPEGITTDLRASRPTSMVIPVYQVTQLTWVLMNSSRHHLTRMPTETGC
jgi:parallel beta-helix repeat protein/predicted outer membrane repeat protein